MPSYRIPRKVRKRFATTAKTTWKWIASPFALLWKSLSWSVSTFAKWWKHRQLKHLLFGLPGLLLLSGAIYVYVMHRSYSGFERGQTYLTAGQREFRQQHWNTAEQFLSRAIELGINTPSVRFQLAQAAQKSGDTSRVIAILSDLAPVDHAVYAPAHLWQATQLLSTATPENVSNASAHLKHALQLEPRNRIAHSLAGDIAYQRQDWEAAVFHLERSDPVTARNNLQLSKSLLLTRNVSLASSYAERAVSAGRQELTQNPNNVPSRVALAEALVLQEEFEDAHAVMVQGIQAAPDDPELRKELARVYLLWSETIAVSTLEASERNFQVFQLLARALEQDPNNLLVFDRIMKLMLSGGEIAEAGEKILLQNISAGVVPGVSHLLLGTFTDATAQPDKAAFHLERAHTLLQNSPIVTNNLAWHLMIQPNPNLPRALQLIDSVVAKHPENAAFRETRGQILVRLNRYREALEELEFALPNYRDQPELHESLIQIYQHLKLPDLAAQHQQILANLRKNPPNSASTAD